METRQFLKGSNATAPSLVLIKQITSISARGMRQDTDQLLAPIDFALTWHESRFRSLFSGTYQDKTSGDGIQIVKKCMSPQLKAFRRNIDSEQKTKRLALLLLHAL